MTHDKEIPSKVEVVFAIENYGMHKEVYNLLCSEDVLAWKLNNKKSAANQISVKVLEFIENTEENLNKINLIRAQANDKFEKYKNY